MCEISCELGYRFVYNTHAAELKPEAGDGNSYPGPEIQLGYKSVPDYL